jgi:hypothetical protein
MLTTEDKEYLKELLELASKSFEDRFENRLSAVERELNHVHDHMMTEDEARKLGEEARKIFRTDTLKVNAWTRIAVATIAALAVIGNGTSNVLVDHTESKAMAKYETETDRKLASYEARINQSNRELIQSNKELASEVRAALAERDVRVKALIVKAGNP